MAHDTAQPQDERRHLMGKLAETDAMVQAGDGFINELLENYLAAKRDIILLQQRDVRRVQAIEGLTAELSECRSKRDKNTPAPRSDQVEEILRRCKAEERERRVIEDALESAQAENQKLRAELAAAQKPARKRAAKKS